MLTKVADKKVNTQKSLLFLNIENKKKNRNRKFLNSINFNSLKIWNTEVPI